ncbi:MAG: S-methyl-5'-thioadenosine phosphorylase [Chloroflexi bacterium]|nr:S-methyl-5'-thioadenosine phosphorylase [Chloroflexota bacterium]
MERQARVGVIGGSGLYNIEGLANKEEIRLTTPFGDPSDAITVGILEGIDVAFLPRHGRGHRITPSELNFRANIFAMKQLGVRQLVSISACGSLREAFAPGHVVIPDQLFDWTRQRELTFFGRGLVAHIGLADPYCPHLSQAAFEATVAAGGTAHKGGTLITIEGPRFSTKAESRIYRQWGLDIIGMTGSPEAQLAREAEICYTCVAHITDYDVWHESEEPVTVEMVIQQLSKNVNMAKASLLHLLRHLPDPESCACGRALDAAIMTDLKTVPPQTKSELWPLVQRFFGEAGKG